MSETHEQFAALVKALIEAVREHGRVFESTMAVIAAHSDLAAENGRLDALRAALLASHAALEQRAKAAEADLGRAYGDKERAERRVRDLEWALWDVRHRLMTIPDRPGPNSLDIIDAALRGTGEGT